MTINLVEEEIAQLALEYMQALTAPGPVHILDDFGHVDRSVVQIAPEEEVCWTNDTGGSALIVFDRNDSPFAPRWIFRVLPGEQIGSGTPTAGCDPNKRYKYTVVGPKGNHDPVVIIDR